MRLLTTLLLAFTASAAEGHYAAQPCEQEAKVKPSDEAPPALYGKGYKPPTDERRAQLYAERKSAHGKRLANMSQFQTLPASFDCRAKGWVLPVGNQANCGSCYLYSTIYGTLSQAFVRAGYGKADGSFVMAVQYGMDCHNFGGCNGGNGTEVIDWVVTNGWPAEVWVDADGKVHKDYPAYTANSKTCRKVTGAKYWKPADWGFATGDQSNRPATTDEIKTALYNYGPLNVSLDAGGQFGNGAGTITALGNNIDHEIELVAYDDAKDGGAFLLKNQWDVTWGNQGYRWLTYKAAARLVDVFWVSVAPLPPPPDPDPVPSKLPVITSALSVTGAPGKVMSYQIAATNSPTAFGSSALPVGMTLDASGKIHGTPTVEATTTVTVSATNSAGTGTAQVQFTVSKVPVPPPVSNDNIVITLDGKTRTFELFPPGSKSAMIVEREQRIKLLQSEIDALKTLNSPKVEDPPPVKEEPKKTTWSPYIIYGTGDVCLVDGTSYVATRTTGYRPPNAFSWREAQHAGVP